jgi:hypothetical protein
MVSQDWGECWAPECWHTPPCGSILQEPHIEGQEPNEKHRTILINPWRPVPKSLLCSAVVAQSGFLYMICLNLNAYVPLKYL